MARSFRAAVVQTVKTELFDVGIHDLCEADDLREGDEDPRTALAEKHDLCDTVQEAYERGLAAQEPDNIRQLLSVPRPYWVGKGANRVLVTDCPELEANNGA